MNSHFNLTTAQLLDIANDLKEKIETGLKTDGTEIKALPTYIHPKKDGINGDAVVFDLGGTNFRAAVISVGENTSVKEIVEKNITEMKNIGFSKIDLFESQFQTINQLNVSNGLPVGYCFSYPAKSLVNGDSELIKWVKGVSIPGMEGNEVGKPLLDYLNQKSKLSFEKIAVVNDTITSLFAGLKNPGFDAYVGLIVGTGTNMATFYPSESIPKIKDMSNWSGETPVNLETGNFSPPHLTVFDDEVDKNSDNPGVHRFEKAISGMYLGSVFKAVFPDEDFGDDFDAENLTYMINNPEKYSREFVSVALQIYERSAKLVAASLAGLVNSLHETDPEVKKIQILAEGSLFWSKIKNDKSNYSEIVADCLRELIKELEIGEKEVKISSIENANLIGAAMSVLS